jgi:hypothetical protein
VRKRCLVGATGCCTGTWHRGVEQVATERRASGGGGTGSVFFRSTVYRFAIGGLGVEGSAVAIIQTSGEVYRLRDIADFPGTYRRAPKGSAILGQSGGGLWLQNERATILHLQVPPLGRMPDLGGDALRVVLDQ